MSSGYVKKCFSIDRELWNQVKAQEAETGDNASAIVRHALRHYFQTGQLAENAVAEAQRKFGHVILRRVREGLDNGLKDSLALLREGYVDLDAA
jgi:negative regulator of replication initiation